MRSPARALVGLALLIAAGCAQPDLLRDGVRVPYEQAAEVDLAAARAHVQAGDLEQARARLQRFLDELPRSQRVPEALFLLGDVDDQLGQKERAAADWRTLVEGYGDSRFAPEAALRAAQIYRDLGRLETGRRLLADVRPGSGDASTRVRLNRMHADLARALGDFDEAVLALAYARRDVADPDVLREVDLELEELIDSRLHESELDALVVRLPRGPVYDRVNLVLASRALSRGDRERARAALDRLPDALRPADQALRERLQTRLERGQGSVAETIGLAVPLTGPYRSFGESVLRGVVLALGLYDDPDARFHLVVRDTRGDETAGAEAVRELVDAGASGIIGPLRSTVAEAAAPVAEEAAVPLLTLARREEVAHLGDYVFRLGLSKRDEARALARFSTQNRGFHRFAILYPDDAYGRDFKNLFWDAVEEQGGQIVGVEGYGPEAVDWQEEIKKLVGLYYLTRDERRRVAERDRLRKRPERNADKLAEPQYQGLPPYVDFEALFIPDGAAKAGLILPQLRFYDVRKVTYLGGSSWNDRSLVEIAGSEARRAIFVDAFHPDSPIPEVKAFVARFVGSYGDAPDAQAAEGYDAALLLSGRIGGNGGLTRADLRRALLDVRDFHGVSGVTSFDDFGGTRKEVHFLTVRNDQIQALDAAP